MDNSTVTVDNKKCSRAGQKNNFFMFWPHFNKKNISQCNKTFGCIVALSRKTFWFKLFNLLAKNKISIEHFREFSCKIVPKYTLKCSQLI